jgi:hypothetical protein
MVMSMILATIEPATDLGEAWAILNSGSTVAAVMLDHDYYDPDEGLRFVTSDGNDLAARDVFESEVEACQTLKDRLRSEISMYRAAIRRNESIIVEMELRLEGVEL